MQLVECVPNFSEGCDLKTIGKISEAISTVEGAHLLDVDSSAGANRTVMTFVGEPEAVCEAAFQAIAVAKSEIDMGKQRGEHPRIGATDVCPFVPLAGLTMGECVELSQRLARRVAQELEIPVYLYANSAQKPERRRLAFLRKGQYEGLEQRMKQDHFRPDYGPIDFNPRTGATAIGARDLLIAFNVNLATESRLVAQNIAKQIRQARSKHEQVATLGSSGNVSMATSADNQTVGNALFDCTALGWYIKEYKRAQVSMNIMDFRKTSLYKAFLEVKRLAKKCGTTVTGSEVVGLLPLQSMLETGRYSLKTTEVSDKADDKELIEAAIAFLNLSDIRPFEARRKILEFRLQNLPPLFNMSPTL